jgi:hypothetical protein
MKSLWVIERKRTGESEFHIPAPFRIYKSRERAESICDQKNNQWGEHEATCVFRVREYREVDWVFKPAVGAALRQLVLDHMRSADHTEVWEDILTGDTVTIEQLLALVLGLPGGGAAEGKRATHG